MARKFYTCIIVPDASQQLHKLRIPVKGLYVLAVIGILSFFAAVGLGFNYIGMASRMAGYQDLEAENARLKVDTRQLKLSTTKLNRQIAALESEAEKITKALVEADPVFKRLVRSTGSVGGSKTDVSTSELEGSLQSNVELIRQRMQDVERNLGLLDARSKNMRSTPRIWPVLNGRIGSHYGGRLDPFTGESETHFGIDIVAPKGTPIKATADGVVIYSAWQGDYGNLVVLKHPNGFTTRYAHLSKFRVKEGDIVKRNDTIGLVGTTGRTTAAHLHYEVRLNDRAVNPRPYLIN
jgi:murein DD-endopeptidase MepM/ murein hydrolase activator NlpD